MPLPWHRPKPAEEDPSPPQSVEAILASPTYLLAEHDPDFITRPESREPRLQIEYLKADTALTDEQIDQTAALLLSLDCNPHKCPSDTKARSTDQIDLFFFYLGTNVAAE